MAVLLLTLAGCTLGPKYKRPEVTVPPQYRGAAAAGPSPSVAETHWQDLFQDDTLKQLIAEALKNNFDLGIASERVIEARARFRITGAEHYPFLTAQSGFTANRPSRVGSNPMASPDSNLDVSYTQAGGALSWELDLFGRIRKLKESARAQYLATEEARRGVLVSLIADVASSYYTLRERDLERQIAVGTRDTAQQSLKLVELRHQRGVATALDVHQAEQLLYTATAQIASAERDIGQAENALNLLLGRLPGDVARGNPVDDFGLPPELPPGLPSMLLERRPDIRQAEETLIAANAQIGVAKAYYFPQISLTGFLGGQSRALTSLFTGPARFWTVAPTGALPIFSAGQVRVGVRLTEAQKREMVIAYRQTVYRAFREVSDALIGYERTRQQRAEQERLVHASSETARLSRLRYEGGLDSYLQVLDAERGLFQARLGLAQLRLRELTGFVEVYKSLGGGWR